MTYSTPPPPPPPGYGATPAAPQNAQGLVAMILGIVAIPLVCCVYIGLPVGIAAAVLGYMGKQKADRGLATNGGQALAGIITGVIAVVFALILLVLQLGFDAVELPTTPG